MGAMIEQKVRASIVPEGMVGEVESALWEAGAVGHEFKTLHPFQVSSPREGSSLSFLSDVRALSS